MENLSLSLFLCFFPRFVSICRSLLAIKYKDDEGIEEDGSMFHVSFSFFFFFNESSKYVQGFLSPVGLTRNGNSVYRNALAALEMQ